MNDRLDAAAAERAWDLYWGGGSVSPVARPVPEFFLAGYFAGRADPGFPEAKS